MLLLIISIMMLRTNPRGSSKLVLVPWLHVGQWVFITVWKLPKWYVSYCSYSISVKVFTELLSVYGLIPFIHVLPVLFRVKTSSHQCCFKYEFVYVLWKESVTEGRTCSLESEYVSVQEMCLTGCFWWQEKTLMNVWALVWFTQIDLTVMIFNFTWNLICSAM